MFIPTMYVLAVPHFAKLCSIFQTKIRKKVKTPRIYSQSLHGHCSYNYVVIDFLVLVQ